MPFQAVFKGNHKPSNGITPILYEHGPFFSGNGALISPWGTL
jgi:hypothetical protein